MRMQLQLCKLSTIAQLLFGTLSTIYNAHIMLYVQ